MQLWTSPGLKANPAKILTYGDWMLSQSRTTSSRRRDPTVLGTAKLKHRKSIFVAHNARKRCIKKNYEGIHDRFQRDPVYRGSQLKIGWTEEKCIAMDKLAQEDHSYRLSYEEYERYQKHWYLTLNKSGKNAPMRHRSDFRNRSHNNEPSPLRIRRRTSRTNLPVLHGGIVKKTGGAHNFFVKKKCCSRFVHS